MGFSWAVAWCAAINTRLLGQSFATAVLVSGVMFLSAQVASPVKADESDTCPLAAELPIVPGDSPDSIWYTPGEPPESPPKDDGTDWVVITCNSDAPGYRADINLLFGGAASGWARAAVRYWVANNGDPDSSVAYFSLCRQGPSQGHLVQEPPTDPRCTQP